MAHNIGLLQFGAVLCVVAVIASMTKGCHDSNCCNPICMIQNSNAVCCKEYQGRMRFQAQQKLLEICDGHEWLKIDLKSTPGQKSNPAASCKDILSHMTEPSQQKNGVYWIRFRGGVIPVYCDMKSDGGGWTMVFKAVAGVRIRNGVRRSRAAGFIWKDTSTYNEKNRSVLDVTNRVKAFYKNRIVLSSNWPKFRPRQAKVVLYVHGRVVKKLTFNAVKTTSVNWFSLSKFDKRTSPWKDLAKKNKVQFFDITDRGACHPHPKCRTFFINRSYAGCPHDYGWMVLPIGPTAPCDWEIKNRTHVPAILYSKKRGYVNWNDRKSVGEADVMAVFVR